MYVCTGCPVGILSTDEWGKGETDGLLTVTVNNTVHIQLVELIKWFMCVDHC